MRFTYNWALYTRSTAYKERCEKLFYNQLSALLHALKGEFPWLKDVSSVPVQQSLRNWERAFKNFFEGRAAYPTFKKKQNAQSATYASNAFKWDGSALTLTKMDAPLAIHCHRPLPKKSKPRSVTIRCPECSTLHDRDTNAAKNILAEGLSVAACGGGVRPVRAKVRRATSKEAGNSHS